MKNNKIKDGDEMQKRRQRITEIVNREGRITFAHLKEAFPDISEMTLRTDLKYLDETGAIIRVHGGAKSIDTVAGTDGFLAQRIVRNQDKKLQIAQKAVSLVHGKGSTFIDSGSTTTLLCRYFPDEARQIYTSSVSCVTELAALNLPAVHLLGGQLNRYSLSVIGGRSLLALQGCHFEICFLGVTSFHPDMGFCCQSEGDCVLKQVALAQSDYRVALMDSTKFNQFSTHCICPVQGVDALVCDDGITDEQREYFTRQGIVVY